jgi:hypothetical protein
MARNFARVNEQYLEHSAPVVTVVPFTFACKFKTDNDGVNQDLFSISDTAGDTNFWVLRCGCNLPNDPLRFLVNGSVPTVADSNGITAGTWYSGICDAAAANARNVWLDQANGSNGTSATPSSLDVTTIGRLSRNAPTNYMSGDIAEVAIWSSVLSSTDRARLVANVRPHAVRPDQLVAYWPLLGGNPNTEPDLKGGFDMTVNGPASSTHPTMYCGGALAVTHYRRQRAA